MAIRNEIEAVVNQLVSKPNFLYGTANELNLLVDDEEFPVAMLYNLQSGELSTTLSQAINDSYSVYMEFLFKTEFDQYTADNETYVKQALALAKEFLVKLEFYRKAPDAARYFKIKVDEKIKALPVYNKFDVNSTGISISFSLTTMLSDNIDPQSRPAPVKP